MNERKWLHMAHATLLLFAVMAMSSFAQSFKTLANFTGTNGSSPYSATLAQGPDGDFYGTTGAGGANGQGTVFKISSGGTLTTLYSFSGPDGNNPTAGLALGVDGNFYGTTEFGGNYTGSAVGLGTIFKITPAGALTTLYMFTGGSDGSQPYAGLILGADGNFYGTTAGGSTIFKISSGGKFTTVYTFPGGTSGAYPYAGLLQAAYGDFYGTTQAGGTGGYGTVFQMTPAGAVSMLHSFQGNDGSQPYAALALGVDGNLYGTTELGGAGGLGTVFRIDPALPPKINFTSGYSFSGSDGCCPTGVLVQANDGNLYGTTQEGGANNFGTIFQITLGGTLTTLHSFNHQDGAYPFGGLLQATDGNFYGTTTGGGTTNNGTVFSLSMGLPQSIKLVPRSGRVGSPVIILGTNMTGVTIVSFNGTPAAFTSVSPTEITTTVPAGANTGRIAVKTANGVLYSGPFLVEPEILSFSPNSGPVGTVVTINGESFTGADNVSFGGVAATNFTVSSDTQIMATVPAGAKSGRIIVTTPSGSALSPSGFLVK
jgi:uncharacterized repeat protein (TIGR03803 family)